MSADQVAAWLSAATLAIIPIAVWYFRDFLKTQFAEQMKGKDSTIETQKAQIQLLEARLKEHEGKPDELELADDLRD